MKIALAQINSELGQFEKNSHKILEYVQRAKQRNCDLVVFPEASLFGYQPLDLLERESLVDQQLAQLKFLEKNIPSGISVLIGAFTKNSGKGKPYFNSAVLLERSRRSKYFNKILLPNYDVFDESRHIENGQLPLGEFMLKGKKILVSICEDIWASAIGSERKSRYPVNPFDKVKSKKIDLVINLSASPFTLEKANWRQQAAKAVVKKVKTPLVYVNMVGAQDELIFDGGSFVLDKKGKLLTQAEYFHEDIVLFDLANNTGHYKKIENSSTENLRQALVLGLRDFVTKSGFHKVHLGVSGGIDSALVACLAVDAFGPANVTGFFLPGPFSSKLSSDLAKKLCKSIHIELKTVSINKSYRQVLSSLQLGFGKFEFGLVNENLQSRLRGISLMAYSNLASSLLLNTSNKSELATGYSTLYGDLTGALCVIGDLTKKQVVDLCALYNREAEVIPKKIISRPPSAELKKNQKDSDSLPLYSRLDKMVVELVEKSQKAKNKSEKEILRKIFKSEFKRWQAPPILKISRHSFGLGRRMPVAQQISEK